MAQILVLAGMSGAGRSSAAAVLEDLGWLVIDNLPASLMSKVAELVESNHGERQKVALVVGRGGADSVEEIAGAFSELRKGSVPVRLLFLEASDEALVRRFEGTRRRHPIGEGPLSEAITEERKRLAKLKDAADLVIDTSDLNVHQLRDRLVAIFERADPGKLLQVSVMSFGFSYGIPVDVDMVIDCRFLPNPHWVPELRNHTGRDEAVRNWVLSQSLTKEFLAKLEDLLALSLPGYVREGKSYLSIAVGCTGGKHRSVVVAEEVASAIAARGFQPKVIHRDIDK